MNNNNVFVNVPIIFNFNAIVMISRTAMAMGFIKTAWGAMKASALTVTLTMACKTITQKKR